MEADEWGAVTGASSSKSEAWSLKKMGEKLARPGVACSIPPMSKHPDERLNEWMTAARQSPNFGVRFLAQLPPAARAEAVRCWSLPAADAAKPGLKKCGPRPGIKCFSSAQLEAFARSIGRVG